MENLEKKMENEMESLGPSKGAYRDITPNNVESTGTENENGNGNLVYDSFG